MAECILCGKCLEVCPLLAATGREELAPRSKAGLVELLRENGAPLNEEDAAKLAGLCLGCGRCREKCPQGVDVPELVALLRGAHPDFKRWLWKTWLTRARQLWGTAGLAARMIPEKFSPEALGPLLKMLSGLRGDGGPEPFVEMAEFSDAHQGERVLLFGGCTARYVRTGWLATARTLLDGLGVEYAEQGFTCCGSGLASVGCLDEARDMAQTNIEVWRGGGKPRLVSFCASCLAGLAHYPDLFPDLFEDNERDAWLASLTPLSLLLRGTRFTVSDSGPASVGYHHPCHAPVPDEDLAMLKSMLGPRLGPVTTKECCGFGGVMQLGAPGLADQVNARCWERLAGAEIVVTGCSACAARLAATVPEGVTAVHWLELLRG